MTNTGCKNITYREELNDYFVQLSRNRKKFNQAFNTLAEAIEYRDKAIQFYEEFRRLPSAKELGLRRRVHRRKSNNLLNERYISFDKRCGKRPYRIGLTNHGVYFTKNLATLEEAIETRNKLLQFIKDYDRLLNRNEREELFGLKFKPRKKHASKKRSKSNTGVMYVSFNTSYDRYQVQLTRQQKRFSAVSHALEGAIAIRDEALKFYEEHGYLPSTAERLEIAKKGTIS